MLGLIFLQTPNTGIVTDTTASAAKAAATEGISFFDMLLKGGYVMIPLLLLSLLAVYLFIERYLYIQNAKREDQHFVNAIKEKLREGKVKDAISICQQKNNLAIARMLEKALNRIGSPVKDIESAIENMANIEINRMEKNLGLLGAIAAIAPMLGFLGTVLGMIKAFYNISIAQNISIGIIASGIYEKMVTSATGLTIGVLSYVFYTYLNSMIDRAISNLEETAIDFIDVLYKPVS